MTKAAATKSVGNFGRYCEVAQRKVVAVKELDRETLTALAAARMDQRHNKLNLLMD